MKNYYVVTFDTKMGGDKSWIINVEADNLRQAKQTAEELWPGKAHMFHVEVRRLRYDEEYLYHWFTRRKSA